MRAKMKVSSVLNCHMTAVGIYDSIPPIIMSEITITNPEFLGIIQEGQEYDIDFTLVQRTAE